LEFENVGFSGEKKTGELGDLTLGKRAKKARVNNKLIEPRPHWWEASDLNIAPSLLPRRRI